MTRANKNVRLCLNTCIGYPRCPVLVWQVRENVRVPWLCQVATGSLGMIVMKENMQVEEVLVLVEEDEV
jgi:hypothetical protein